ncbi:spirocyclase AveC family protein [Nocardia sp. NPDC057227]|uniref:spirocyclase AveC family protein n=1 Tax=Nocardia sp. NPDC057227 TaxID=3346056 RepID=UPI00362A0075
MSGPEDKGRATVVEPAAKTAALGGEQQAAVKPVQIWAFVGAAILLLQVYVWIRWISGPYFERVPAGPTELPTAMKTILTVYTAGIVVLFPVSVWWFIVRPWRRERQITLDGMLIGAMGLMFFQDPLLNYVNTWCTYNTWMWNRGSWSSHIPGWISPEEPGRQVAEPLLMNAPGYAYGVLLCTIAGCWVMRKVKARRPGMSNLRLIGVTAVIAFVFDFVMEGLVLMPMGLYSFPGSIQALSINAGTYYQWPVYEGLMWGGVQTGLCCLYYFTDDRGRTIAERGLDRVGGGFAKQQATRFLAIFAAVSVIFFAFYNLPAQWFGMHADPWPEDVLERSYFNGGICGAGSDMPCPDPALPLPRKGSGYIDNEGRLIMPDGVTVPEPVPFKDR